MVIDQLLIVPVFKLVRSLVLNTQLPFGVEAYKGANVVTVAVLPPPAVAPTIPAAPSAW